MEIPAHFLYTREIVKIKRKKKRINCQLNVCMCYVQACVCTCGRLKPMLPGAIVWWVLTVNTYLWLGVVFTITCLQRWSILSYSRCYHFILGHHTTVKDVLSHNIIYTWFSNFNCSLFTFSILFYAVIQIVCFAFLHCTDPHLSIWFFGWFLAKGGQSNIKIFRTTFLNVLHFATLLLFSKQFSPHYHLYMYMYLYM